MAIWKGEEMKLIVGLGNPGKPYEGTRHNIGFMLLDLLGERWDISYSLSEKFKGEVGELHVDGEKVFFLKPRTYMNLSGESVRALVEYYGIDPHDILVVYDDMSLPVGAFRYKKKGSSGGQNGMKNIMELLGTKEIPRLKIGISDPPSGWGGKDYVLSAFSKAEKPHIEEALVENIDGVDLFIHKGIEDVMNEMNGKGK